MNSNLTRPLQELRVGDPYALSLPQYSGVISATFDYILHMDRYVQVHTLTAGRSYQFPHVGDLDYQTHIQGTEIRGTKQPPLEERTVQIDEHEIIAPIEESTVDRDIRHYEVWSIYSNKQIEALRQAYEARKIASAVRGARIGARLDGQTGEVAFSSGVLVRRNAATVAAAYPVSQQGSTRFQDDLSQMQQLFTERNVPNGMRVVMTTPYMFRVTLKDRGLTNKDIGGFDIGNNVILRSLEMAEGFTLVESNFASKLFGTNFTQTDESQYNTNMTGTVAVAMTTADCLGAVRYRDIDVDAPRYIAERRVMWANATMWMGVKWLRPEALGELYVGENDYAATMDGKYPAFAPA